MFWKQDSPWRLWCWCSGLARWHLNFITTQNKLVVYFSSTHNMKVPVHKIISCFTQSVNCSGCTFSSSVAVCADAEANICCANWNKDFVGDSPIWHHFLLLVVPHLAYVFCIFSCCLEWKPFFETFPCICKMLECMKQTNRKYFHLDLCHFM